MADREQEAVTALPLRVVRAVAHGVKVRHRQHVGDAERLGDVALTLHLTHEERLSADAIGPVLQRELVWQIWWGFGSFGCLLSFCSLHSFLLGTGRSGLNGSACRRSRRSWRP